MHHNNPFKITIFLRASSVISSPSTLRQLPCRFELLDHDMNAASTRLTRCTSLACRSPYLPVIHSPHWILFGLETDAINQFWWRSCSAASRKTEECF
ncbi:hypothetical protein C1H46_003341 [Malus baccata]|uniref:Uncharacterized protein n=1 Tax=Malus baccata TaxID=106549 RepID=A0A540NJ71_MALBA|nr:hypothetical protein C1H46_003341 [Malus baccata]